MTDSAAPADPDSSPRAAAERARRERESAALRANLQRRKQQARARSGEPATGQAAVPDEDAPCR